MPTPTSRKHPAVVEFEKFQAKRADMFAGAAEGRYLANRLNCAFQEGWSAAERAIKEALTGQRDE